MLKDYFAYLLSSLRPKDLDGNYMTITSWLHWKYIAFQLWAWER